MSPSINSAVLSYARGGAMSLGDAITSVTLAFNLVGAAITLAGAIVLVLRPPRRVGGINGSKAERERDP